MQKPRALSQAVDGEAVLKIPPNGSIASHTLCVGKMLYERPLDINHSSLQTRQLFKQRRCHIQAGRLAARAQIRHRRVGASRTVTDLDPLKAVRSALIDVLGQRYNLVVGRVPFSTRTLIGFEKGTFATKCAFRGAFTVVVVFMTVMRFAATSSLFVRAMVRLFIMLIPLLERAAFRSSVVVLLVILSFVHFDINLFHLDILHSFV